MSRTKKGEDSCYGSPPFIALTVMINMKINESINV